MKYLNSFSQRFVKEVLQKLGSGEIHDRLRDYKLINGYKNSIYDALSNICGGDKEASLLLLNLGYIGIRMKLNDYVNYLIFDCKTINIIDKKSI